MTHRGLYFCAEETCILAPEKWRGRFGLCLKHALHHGWIERAPELDEIKKLIAKQKKDFLTRLQDGLKNNNLDDVLDETFPYMAPKKFPTSEPVPHWSEYRETPF